MSTPPRLLRRRLWMAAMALLLGAGSLTACGSGDGTSTGNDAGNGTVADAGTSSSTGDETTTTATTAPPSSGDDDSDEDDPVVTGGDTEVVIADYAFDPDDLEVPVGAEVTFANTDGVTHTATARDPGVFDTGEVEADDSAGVRFDEPGSYAYYCAIHPTMTGEVTVR